MRVTRLITAAALMLASSFALADDAEQAIRKTLTTLQLDVPVESVAPAPLNGLYEVRLQGGRVLYASADGQYVMQGYLYQVQGDKPVNLTERAERAGVAKLIGAIPQDQMVVFPAQGGKAKSVITVFTDTTCPYCQKLHAEVPKLNAMGIEVRYLAFPRQGLNSPGDEQLQAVWCSKDRPASLSKMINGKSVDAPKCDNPVSKQFALGQQIGINGTPAIILESGQMIPGYQPAAQLGKLALDSKG
ncbi:bifunctional protein-disulfide isomerase/oxidoreductase DsbC [Pseudomonas sp. KNUC1026]|uniref:bifunctional protein-disulfide isomerase/oxidoreductase DsbC n=1 Tax=Pseudomonas sp. KNUC1026 TaxID=2893890 RepID=UPI001F22448A|nr:bifunctional protein-disulfide isomerase/oxidoreductase DsbC [Pseudomonas sp. KNUC1026]UFH48595.1 bifunctional protein-disulfide isomerase/oxidoreductase DsbC [Pseudomonas sp. KNUC1026]